MTAIHDQLRRTLDGAYEIDREIGRGGMATVFLARDLKHHRKVALKVLDPELGAVLGAERFLSEIRVTAALQHPNLLPLFDSGAVPAGHPERSEGPSLLYYVMPYVEGESLRHRLEREKQLPIDEAVRIATAVANALDYAHAHGVIHRDLKPENILLQHGQPVVADFGIALAVSNAGGARVTQTGLSLGTPQYMSPEQATGDRTIDARTDIYSLAAVTYEMLTGEPPHTGSTAQAIIAKLMTTEPQSVRALRPTVSPNVAMAVECGLAKLPADRFASAKAFSDALANRGFTTMTAAGTTSALGVGARGVSPRLFAAVSLVAVLAIAAAVWSWRRPAPPPPPQARFALELPDSQNVVPTIGQRAFAIAPDGSEILYAGAGRSGTVLYRRRLNELVASELPGSANAVSVVYEPNGRALAIQNRRRLTVLSRTGGPASEVADDVGRPSWGDASVIAFQRGSSIWAVNSGGGAARRLTTADSSRGGGHNWPHVLPGGKAVLFNSYSQDAVGWATYDVRVVSIDGGEETRLELKGTDPRYVPTGHILIAQADGSVLAQPFDLNTLQLAGAPVRVLENVLVKPSGAALYDVSRNGILAYVEGNAAVVPVIVDRTGRQSPLNLPAGEYAHLRLSPTGDRVVLERFENGQSDIWLVGRGTGQAFRLTRDGRSRAPEWSPDGTRVAWIYPDSTGNTIRWQNADGSGAPRQLPTHGYAAFLFQFAPDGKSLVAVVGSPFRHDIVLLPLDSAGKPLTIASSPADELQATMSPDGRWVAYSSNETGRAEVFVTSVDDPSTKVQVTNDGGAEPTWRSDGKTLVVRSGALLEITLSFTPRIEVTRRDTLFTDVFRRGGADRSYDVMPKTGDVVALARDRATRDRIVVVTGWLDELRQRMAQASSP